MTTWKDEIQSGPLSATLAPYVAAGDDATIAALLNAKTINAVRSVSRQVFVRWAAKTGIRAVIQDVSVIANDPLRSSALALLDIIQGGGTDGIDFSDADNIAMLAGWVALDRLTNAQRSELLALATIKISQAEYVMGLDATVIDVAEAVRNADGTRSWT